MAEEALEESLDTEQTSQETPDNFAEQLGSRLGVIFQREMDPSIGAKEASKFIYESTYPDKISYYIDGLEALLESPTTDKYAALSWTGLVTSSAQNKDYDTYLHSMLDQMIESYYGMEKPDVELKERKFSAITIIMAKIFIKMYELNTSNADTAADIYSILVRKEMDLDVKAKDDEEDEGGVVLPDLPKMFEEVLDYLVTRSEFKAQHLGEENPFEHIVQLAERLRQSRRYVTQDVLNQRALEKKKQTELELENQLASAEELILGQEPFVEGLALFIHEKRYNYKFLAVEKVRMTLQLLGSIVGAIYFLIGYMDYWGVDWIDGTLVCLAMVIFTRLIGGRKRFQSAKFYPMDVSKELEQHSTQFINVFRKMSMEQMEHFLVRQVKMDRNRNYLALIPEYVKYMFAIMPDRKNMFISMDELSELVENAEIEIAKAVRGHA